MTVYLHDPDSVLDYTFDWSEWLPDGDTIVSADVAASQGLSVDSTTVGSTAVTVWLSTDGTVGPRTLSCEITTTGGRTTERTIQIEVTQR